MTTGLVPYASDIDSVSLQFNDAFTFGIKVLIALFLFGIALDARVEDFVTVLRRPVVLVAGLLAQFVLMPAITLLLTLAFDVQASVALGLLLVACCPAGNVSNLLTHRARGDVALSMSLTTVSNAVAVLATPLALAFWGGLHPEGSALLAHVSLDPWDMVGEVALLIGLPFAAGVFTAARWPSRAARLQRAVEPATLGFLLLLVVVGLAGRMGQFLDYVGILIGVIAVQNLLALLLGWSTGRVLRLSPEGRRAMTFEVGVRNTGLSLVLAMSFFAELGGITLVQAFWGLWDVVIGLLLASCWRSRQPATVPVRAQ